MLRLIISGCNGHMGRVVSSLCEADPDLAVAAGFDLLGTADREFPVFSSPAEFSGEADVVVDFSSTAALPPPGLLHGQEAPPRAVHHRLQRDAAGRD